jgi:polyisoprenoid-binding protein YceI
MAIWKIDQSHSEIKFKVKHLVISTVTGQFNNFMQLLNQTILISQMQKLLLKQM